MKFSKSITINLGNYESIKIGVDDAPSFEDCDKMIVEELMAKKIGAGMKIHQFLAWSEKRV